MRAVASVWPYITNIRPPRAAILAWNRPITSGWSRPPAWVSVRSDGTSSLSMSSRWSTW